MKLIKLNTFLVLFILFSVSAVNAQEWMSNLKIAQKLALVQNKMVLMVWEEETYYDFPVMIVNSNNQATWVNNLFDENELSKAIWQHFIPVVVSEYVYDDFYNQIKKKRSQNYLNKFSDGTLKVMDVNGNIVNVNMGYDDSFNLSKLITDYSFNTEFLSLELKNYVQSKTFFTSYFLASRYLDFSLYHKPTVRQEIVNLAKIYINHAEELLTQEPTEKQAELKQRLEMLELQTDLIEGKPGIVLRKLKRMDRGIVHESNKSYQAFLYFTAHKIRRDNANAEIWRPLLSTVNLNLSQSIIKINSR